MRKLIGMASLAFYLGQCGQNGNIGASTNRINGQINQVKGQYNNINGNSNNVQGHRNMLLLGNNNSVRGSDNQVMGNGNVVVSFREANMQGLEGKASNFINNTGITTPINNGAQTFNNREQTFNNNGAQTFNNREQTLNNGQIYSPQPNIIQNDRQTNLRLDDRSVITSSDFNRGNNMQLNSQNIQTLNNVIQKTGPTIDIQARNRNFGISFPVNKVSELRAEINSINSLELTGRNNARNGREIVQDQVLTINYNR